MAQPITQFAVVEVAKPNIGEKRPSRVRADVTINLSVRKEIKSEWENLRKHDVCFLITVKPQNPIGKTSSYIHYPVKFYVININYLFSRLICRHEI